MLKRWRTRRDPIAKLEAELRAGRPEPSDAFIDELARAVVVAQVPRARRWARTAVALAVLTAGFAVFGAYGGIGYAAKAAEESYESFRGAVSPDSGVTKQNDTPGEHQYGGGGDEGCTPGYWKHDKHFDSWMNYDPGDSFNATFGVTYFSATLTLGGAVALGSAIPEALARHAVAALLNAASPGVDYAYTEAQVKAMVSAAFNSGDLSQMEDTKDLLEGANEEDDDCPLN